MTDRTAKAGDLMTRLARLNPAPAPGAPEPLTAEALALRDRALAHPVPVVPPRRRRRGTRPFVAVAFAALALAGGSLAAGVWSVDDIPLPGPAGQEFSASVEEVVAHRYIRERPPTYDELPPRPAIAFPRGTTYWQAVGQLWAARHAGARIPDGVRVVPPLPEGKVLRVAEDGSVTLDPAAPVGYDPYTGLVVAGFSGPPHGGPRALDACQVILPGRPGPTCDGAPSGLVQQERDGTWVPVIGTAVTVPTQIAGTTGLSVLERPRAAADRLTEDEVGSTPDEVRQALLGHGAPPAAAGRGWDLDAGRLALERDGFRYYVIPAPDDSICLVVRAADGSKGAMTCDDRLALVTAGAISLTFDGGGRRFAGVVGDGFDTVSASGASEPIVGNVAAIRVPKEVHTVTMSGPAGHHQVRVF
jgi:hypothetical protein